MCIRKGSGVRGQGSVRSLQDAFASLKPETCHLTPQKGFTLLELLITLAVIAVVVSLASSPDLEKSNAQKSFNNTANNLQAELSSQRFEAMSRNTTTRMVITNTAGVYTITTYFADAPTTVCTAGGATWTTLVNARVLDVHASYQITGTPMANTCFYRDGTSSGGTLTVSPVTASPDLKTATLTITIATGFLDVDIQ